VQEFVAFCTVCCTWAALRCLFVNQFISISVPDSGMGREGRVIWLPADMPGENFGVLCVLSRPIWAA
jgi:hypothetical protein